MNPSDSPATAPEVGVRHLVLLPGLDGTGLLFTPLLRQFSPTYALQVISYPADRFLSYDELQTCVRQQLPAREPFALLGESFSGPLAVRLAAESPAGLRGVLLAATFVRKPVRWLPRWFGCCLPTAAFRLFPWWGQLRVLSSGKATSELRELYRRALSQVAPKVLAKRVNEVLRVDVCRQFQELNVPMLILAGRYDRTVPAHNLRLMQRLRSGMRIEMIDSDHLLLQTEPEDCARRVTAFLQSL